MQNCNDNFVTGVKRTTSPMHPPPPPPSSHPPPPSFSTPDRASNCTSLTTSASLTTLTTFHCFIIHPIKDVAPYYDGSWRAVLRATATAAAAAPAGFPFCGGVGVSAGGATVQLESFVGVFVLSLCNGIMGGGKREKVECKGQNGCWDSELFTFP